jgi:hypothetical protein
LIGTTNPLRDCKWVVIEVWFSASHNGFNAATNILTEWMGRVFCPRYREICVWVLSFFGFHTNRRREQTRSRRWWRWPVADTPSFLGLSLYQILFQSITRQIRPLWKLAGS